MDIRKFDTIKKGTIIIEGIYNKYPEFGQLDELKKIASQRELTPEQITRITTKISTLMFRVGTLVTELTTGANEAYIYRKYKYLWEFSQLSNNDMRKTDKESVATEKSFNEYEQELINRFVADWIKTEYDNYNRLVSVLQSRMAIIRSEMFNKL